MYLLGVVEKDQFLFYCHLLNADRADEDYGDFTYRITTMWEEKKSKQRKVRLVSLEVLCFIYCAFGHVHFWGFYNPFVRHNILFVLFLRIKKGQIHFFRLCIQNNLIPDNNTREPHNSKVTDLKS